MNNMAPVDPRDIQLHVMLSQWEGDMLDEVRECMGLSRSDTVRQLLREKHTSLMVEIEARRRRNDKPKKRK